jgi:hypothetical protein
MNSKLTDCSVAEHGYAVLTAETPSYNSKATDTKPVYSINPLTDIDCQQESGSGVIDLQVSPAS